MTCSTGNTTSEPAGKRWPNAWRKFLADSIGPLSVLAFLVLWAIFSRYLPLSPELRAYIKILAN